MKHITRYIATKQSEFATHGFFTRFSAEDPRANVLDSAAGLTFWVFTFQDVLRLNEARISNPALRKVARHHSAEDRGHDVWFAQDIAAIDPAPRDFSWLFGRHHAQTRDASYALIAEVFRATDDYERIVLLLTLESAGHVFFERVAEYVDRVDPNTTLRYFSRWHLDVEKDHELFEAELATLLDVELDPQVTARAIAMIDRCYEAFSNLFTGLEARLVRRAGGMSSIAAPPLPTTTPSVTLTDTAE
jgi:hypothetical protein